ncbi:MAG: acetyl-CoA carboxylase biotin carboxyl carrier protein [Defluviitaleaceae bacterium]|nr:acetyl-CoA carboxylase biotin carboxyl carrier protein [Defluviitaleaceae bacterium]
MNYTQIRELLEWVDRSTLTNVSVNVGGATLNASKNTGMGGGFYPEMYPSFAPAVAAAPSAPVAVAPAAVSAPSAEPMAVKHADPDETTVKATGHLITSPIVGTFYSSSNPEKPAFAPVGAKVKKGDVLCILEAMKIMNEITADVDGAVVEVFAENGQMVEARQPLFRIE